MLQNAMLRELWLQWQRRKWRARATHPLLQRLLVDPLPDGHFNERRYVVADLETTSLSAAEGEIASIGWVAVEQGRVLLESARHFHIAVRDEVGQSAVFHQLTDTDLKQGVELQVALGHFLGAIRGSTLVFHNAQLDMAFLNDAVQALWGAPLLVPVEDTMQWQLQRLSRQMEVIPDGALRLFQCRARYGLPDAPAHDALGDAIATAELWLAINAE
ncbi:3'-5' exonuclease [Biformimicrobium ophioploci]|uniref:3'-5' exonuclease n=1 Tax=Biformimicrobium ophioploci TaxID=3036711 RepID=A0ABQ6M0W7_9GAMM|nr:3'-5' exonuclease [Microbulbifer sp. NKW57]GMG87999.1 3'-5' exonuclease [Microbulbifer sp. NKW57]